MLSLKVNAFSCIAYPLASGTEIAFGQSMVFHNQMIGVCKSNRFEVRWFIRIADCINDINTVLHRQFTVLVTEYKQDRFDDTSEGHGGIEIQVVRVVSAKADAVYGVRELKGFGSEYQFKPDLLFQGL